MGWGWRLAPKTRRALELNAERGAAAGAPHGGRRRAQRGRPTPAIPGLAPRREAARLVADIVGEGQSMAAVLEAFDTAAPMDPRDQALTRAIARTTVRRLGDIDWCLAALMDRPLPKKAAAVRRALQVSAAQLLFMRQADHAVVSTAVALLKSDATTAGFSGLANAVLRRLTRERDDLLARLPVEANTPPWLWARWQTHYGAAAALIAAQHREEPSIDLAFAAPPSPPWPEGAAALPTGGLRIPSGPVDTVEGFREGGWWVQDFAAQLPVTMLGDVAGRDVLDLCAAPGGKTMQLAAKGARVTAVEADATRAERLAENLARTQLSDRVTVVVGDARHAEGAFDAVLLDAPCTATGTLRRQPDVAWARSPSDIATLAKVQRTLLSTAARRLKSGGRLVYATCSLEPEEGEAQADALLAEGFGLTPLTPTGPAAPFSGPDGRLRTLPHYSPAEGLTGMDGFFAAAFERA